MPRLPLHIWRCLTATQKHRSRFLYVAGGLNTPGKVVVRSPPSWLTQGNQAALQFMLAAATTQEWMGHDLRAFAARPACPLCHDVNDWAAMPWMHLCSRCHVVGATVTPTRHHTTRLVVEALGLASALYTLGGGVVELIGVVLAALDSHECTTQLARSTELACTPKRASPPSPWPSDLSSSPGVSSSPCGCQ